MPRRCGGGRPAPSAAAAGGRGLTRARGARCRRPTPTCCARPARRSARSPRGRPNALRATPAPRSSTSGRTASGSRATSRAPSTSAKSHLEQEIEAAVPDRSTPVVLYCAGGVRSLFAAQTLRAMGYEDVASMSGGFERWKALGLPLHAAGRPDRRPGAALQPPPPDPGGRRRGPGTAARLEGAARRGGRARLAGRPLPGGRRRRDDRDRRLRRRRRQQPPAPGPPHDRPGRREEGGLRRVAIAALNPDVAVVAHDEVLGPANVERLIAGYDVILDGTDTFETRYTLNDAAVAAGIPVVHASVFRFEGQLTTFVPVRGPVLPLPLPDPTAAGARAGLLGGRGARRRAGDHGPPPGERGAQAPPRHRRHARRAAAPLRRARRHVHRAVAAPRPGLPGLLGRRGRGAASGRPTPLALPGAAAVGPRAPREGLVFPFPTPPAGRARHERAARARAAPGARARHASGRDPRRDRRARPRGDAERGLRRHRRDRVRRPRAARPTRWHATRNRAASPLRYEIHPDDLLRVIARDRRRGRGDLGDRALPRSLAGPPVARPTWARPSTRTPSTSSSRWRRRGRSRPGAESVRAWRIVDGQVFEVALDIGPDTA